MTSELTARGHGDKEDAGNDAHGEQQASHGVGYAIVIPRYQDNKDKSRTIIENLTSTSPPAPSADSQACNQLDEKAKDCALRGKRVSFNNAGQDTTSTLAPRNTQAGSKTTARRMTRSTSCANKMASVSDTTADAGPEL
ncbi:hypothetical protein BGW39_004000 [Mortierella sp. 14UC]|nr:hypothetical protein BGW39_004000 [Mortierella sp. 14UC]